MPSQMWTHLLLRFQVSVDGRDVSAAMLTLRYTRFCLHQLLIPSPRHLYCV